MATPLKNKVKDYDNTLVGRLKCTIGSAVQFILTGIC